MSSPKVVVVGSCFTDLMSYSSRLPKPGETLIGTKFLTGFGGKGGNQCVAAAKLGAITAMVTRLGSDAFGRAYLTHFKNLAVNTSCIMQVEDAPTGSANIMVANSGENCIVVVRGANESIDSNDVCQAAPLIKNASVLVCQLEIPFPPTLAALKLARQSGVTTILNAAPGHANLDPQIFQNIDILCVNESEAEIIGGFPVEDTAGAKRISKVLLDRGCARVVLTLGQNGAVYTNGKQSEAVHIPGELVENAVDTTGAGDAFVGAMAYFLAYHPEFSMDMVIRKACSVAAKSVQKEGTQCSFPDRKDFPKQLFQ